MLTEGHATRTPPDPNVQTQINYSGILRAFLGTEHWCERARPFVLKFEIFMPCMSNPIHRKIVNLQRGDVRPYFEEIGGTWQISTLHRFVTMFDSILVCI